MISPDGTRLVYVGNIPGGPNKLFTRRLDQPNVTELAGTQQAVNPFFSNDGQWVVFAIGRIVYKIPIDGGGPILLGEVSLMLGGHWDDEGSIVIGSGGRQVCCDALNGSVASTNHGARERRDVPDKSADPAGWKAILLEAVGSPSQDDFTIEVVSIADRVRKTLARGVGSPRYLPSGHLVYHEEGDDVRRAVRPRADGSTRDCVQVLDDVAYDAISFGAQYDVSRTGTSCTGSTSLRARQCGGSM